MLVCIPAAGIAQPLPAGGVPPRGARGAPAATVGAALLLVTLLLLSLLICLPPGNLLVARRTQPLLAGGRVPVPVRTLARAGRATLQAASLRYILLLSSPPRLSSAPLQHAVGRQLATMP